MRERTKPILRGLVQLAVVALFGGLARPTLAQSAASRLDCPTHRAVADAVRALLDSSRVEVRDVESKFEIRNDGQRFSVVANGRSRDFDDPELDCIGRTRTAAVFVALTLAPPDIGLPPADQTEPASQTAPAAPVKVAKPGWPSTAKPTEMRSRSTPPVAWRFGIELAAAIQAGPSGSTWRKGLGAELRLVLTKPTWGWTVGAMLTTVEDLHWRASRVDEGRMPIDFGFRWTQIRPWGRTFVDTTAVVAIMQLRQVNSLNRSPMKTVLDVGGKMAIGLHLGHSTFAPAVRVSAEFYPVPREISVDPSGKIGTTAWLWLAAAIGLAGNFH